MKLSRPKISVLIDWYIPGTKAGGPVRSVYSLVSLLKDHFDFFIITTNSDLGKTETYRDVKADILFEKEGIHYYYFSSGNLNSENMRGLLTLINPDLIYLNSFWSANFSINIIRLKKQRKIQAPLLLAPRGMLGRGALGLKSFKKHLFLSIAGVFGWYKSIPFHATQAQERDDILHKFPLANVSVAPNLNSGSVMKNISIKQVNKLKLFYLSRVARIKNLHFALALFQNTPGNYQIEYDIYGNLEDEMYWNECREIIKKLPAHVTVTYKRELQFNEVQGIITGYHALFLPTLNENFGHSIVESLLCGCPAIISDQTPWNDLETYGAGYAIDLNNKKKFLDSILKLAGLNQQEFSQTSQKAINYISKKIDLASIVGQYKTMFNESIKNGSIHL